MSNEGTPLFPHRFNGATPFQAWILCGIAASLSATDRLQWGHALSGMDTGQSQSRSVGEFCGFNGATPFQAWILWLSEHADLMNDGFNGATPFQAWIQYFV